MPLFCLPLDANLPFEKEIGFFGVCLHCAEHSQATSSAQSSEYCMNNNNRITLIIWNIASSFENFRGPFRRHRIT